jgi:hypothetical protein
MLGTLLKHEFKNTWMVMTLTCAVTIILGIVGGLFFRIVASPELIEKDFSVIFITLGVTGIIILLTSLNMVATIYLVVHYYKNLYTSQGYLSFTLPATITEVVSSRMIVACIWSVAFSISMGLCILFGTLIIGTLPDFNEAREVIAEIYEDLLYDPDSVNIIWGIIEFTLTIILGNLSKLLSYFFCISIGQLWSKHKILGAVLCYFGTSFVLGIISTSISFGRMLINPNSYDNLDSFGILTRYMSKGIIYSIITIVIFWVASVVTANKRLNLD